MFDQFCPSHVITFSNAFCNHFALVVGLSDLMLCIAIRRLRVDLLLLVFRCRVWCRRGSVWVRRRPVRPPGQVLRVVVHCSSGLITPETWLP